jgi:hypothetical protein
MLANDTCGVCLLNSCGKSQFKTVIDRGTFIISFFSLGPGDVNFFFSQRWFYCQSASAKFAASLFFVPPRAPSGRPSHWGWGQPARSSPPADTSTIKTLSKMVKSQGEHRYDLLTSSGLLLLCLLLKQSDRSPGRLLASFRSLWRVTWTILADTSWAWANFMTLSRWSISTSAVISVTETIAVRFLWSASAAASSPTSPFDNR